MRRILLAIALLTGCSAHEQLNTQTASAPISGIDFLHNLEPVPGRANTYRPITNFADPQKPLRAGPLCCDSPIVEVGRIAAGPEIRASFPVTNESNNSLIIKRQHWCGGSCAPTLHLFAPGETVDLVLNQLTRHGNGEFTGRLTAEVYYVIP